MYFVLENRCLVFMFECHVSSLLISFLHTTFRSDCYRLYENMFISLSNWLFVSLLMCRIKHYHPFRAVYMSVNHAIPCSCYFVPQSEPYRQPIIQSFSIIFCLKLNITCITLSTINLRFSTLSGLACRRFPCMLSFHDGPFSFYSLS